MEIAGVDFGMMGRVERASHFLDIWHKLTPEQLNELLPEIWVMAEWPGVMYPYDEWTTIFYEAFEAGFISDDGTERPTDYKTKVELYRAATPDYIYGMGWTNNLETAKWFNNRNHTFGWKDSKIYKTVVPKGVILGIFNTRKEDEIIIDPEDAKFWGVEELQENV